MVRQEWKSLFKNKILLLVVAAIIAIPTIYTTLFLGSMWDPYGKVSEMPVAVVNLDQPVTYEGEELKVGEELVNNLKDNDSLSFNFVDAEEAEAGIQKGTYYMVITIPEDFSANAATLMDEHPQKMQLIYETNPGTNYIAMKMSESAMAKIKTSVAEEVTRTYVETVFDQMTAIGDGMQEASDGAGAIEDGVRQLKDGNRKITDNLQVLADSTLTFKEGSESLALGLGDYTEGVAALNTGAGSLSEGTAALMAGSEELIAGISTLNSGAIQLKNGTEAFVDGTKTLALGTVNYVENVEKIKDGMDQLAGLEQLGQVSGGIASLNTAVSTGSDKTPALKDATKSLSEGLDTMYQQVSALKNSTEGEQLSQLAGSLGSAAEGISAAAEGMDTAADTVTAAAEGTASAAAVIDGTVSALNSQIEANNAKIDKAQGSINAQIDEANAAISSQGSEAKAVINDEINSAVSAVNAAREAGAIGDEEADSIISQLKAAMVDTAVSGNIVHVDGSEVMMAPLSAGTSAADLNTISAGLTGAGAGLDTGADTLKQGAASLKKGLSSMPADIDSSALDRLAGGIQAAAAGAAAIDQGTGQVAAGLQYLEGAAESFPQAAAGVAAVREGLGELTAYDEALTAGAGVLLANADDVKAGAGQVSEGVQTLAGAAGPLKDGVRALDTGAGQLYDGTRQLAANNSQLLSGSAQLTEGALQISDGAGKLADGSVTLGDGLEELGGGSDELKTAFTDGADEIKEVHATDEMMDMFSAPVEDKEVHVTEIANNGHAMSAYMMSVALWVGCIAFCIMYPLMKYEGRIRSGFDWWLSKASVLYVIAIGMALVMLGMLHVCNGFNPANWGMMIFITCLASLAFMSIMYFFNVLLGKVGSFLMLIFMVVQLAGAAGTYPIELSGDFVAAIHPWLPFSYTVDAFRVALAGSGSVHHAVMVLAGILIVFTLLTINLFRIRTKENRHGRKNLYEFLEEKGLA